MNNVKKDKNTAEEALKSDVNADHAENNRHKEKQNKKGSRKKTSGKEEEYARKILELEEKIAALEAESQSLKDQLLRKIAEFDNYKRRTEKEFIEHLEYANSELILEILPVIDDFERSLKHMEEAKNEESHAEGIRLIYKKLMSSLERRGLKPIDVTGMEFDPEQHQALMQVDTDEVESGHIVEEHVKGYKLNEKVIRHAQVLVAK